MACPYVTNADALTQSLEDIEREQGSKPDKPKKVGNKCLLFLYDMTIYLEKTEYEDHHGDQ